MKCAACGYERNRDEDAACGMCRAPLAAAARPAKREVEGARRGSLSDLGRRLAIYEQGALQTVGLPILGVVLLAGAAGCVFGLQDINARVSGGLLLGAFGALSLVAGLAERGRHVHVHEHGLVRRKGVERELVLWDEVRAVFQEITRHTVNGVPAGTSHSYKVRCRDGRELVFGDDLVGVASLGEQLQRATTQRLLPGAVEAFDRGEIVEFGDVSVSAKGVRLRTSRLLAWSSVRLLDVEEGYLTFDGPGGNGPDRLEVSRIPNLMMFLALVEHGARRAREA
jgi:hypothetical protein